MIAQSEYIREDEAILAVRSALGNTNIAAANLNLTRGQFLDYMVRHPAVREELKQVREAIKDEAEDLLIEKMKQDNTLLMFFLRTQARDRGYGNDLAVTGGGGGPVDVRVNASALIAAMRNGFDNGSEESSNEDSHILEQS